MFSRNNAHWHFAFTVSRFSEYATQAKVAIERVFPLTTGASSSSTPRKIQYDDPSRTFFMRVYAFPLRRLFNWLLMQATNAHRKYMYANNKNEREIHIIIFI